MRWRWIVLTFLIASALAALAAVVTAQEVIADSVTVRVLERPHLVILEGPQNAYRGDILSFRAKVEDQNGNPTIAFLLWSVNDSTKARVLSVTDSTVMVEVTDTGSVTVRVRVAPLDSLRIAWVDSLGVLAWDGVVGKGKHIQGCALFFSGSVPWAFSAQEACLPSWVARYGTPTRPPGRLSAYGARPPPGPDYLAQLAALIRSSPPADRVALTRRVL